MNAQTGTCSSGHLRRIGHHHSCGISDGGSRETRLASRPGPGGVIKVQAQDAHRGAMVLLSARALR